MQKYTASASIESEGWAGGSSLEDVFALPRVRVRKNAPVLFRVHFPVVHRVKDTSMLCGHVRMGAGRQCVYVMRNVRTCRQWIKPCRWTCSSCSRRACGSSSESVLLGEGKMHHPVSVG